MEVTPPRPRLDQESIVARSHRELSGLIGELERAILARDESRVEDVLIRIRHLDADARLAGMLLGMLSPWLPQLADIPSGTPVQVRARAPESLELGIRALGDLFPLGAPDLMPGDEWRFPELEDAIQWLVDQQAVASRDELANLQQSLHRSAFTVNAESVQQVQKIQAAIADSLRSGDSLPEFRRRVQDIAGVTRAQQETLFRTNTKQAYLAGQQRTLEQPRVKERFRWVYYASTQDNRTRPEHFALDGMVAEVGSSLHRLMLQRQSEYNCRCTLIPLDERKARKYGIKTLADVPAAARQ